MYFLSLLFSEDNGEPLSNLNKSFFIMSLIAHKNVMRKMSFFFNLENISEESIFAPVMLLHLLYYRCLDMRIFGHVEYSE